MKKEKRVERLIVGGLHIDDFQWALREYEEAGYALVGYVLDVDGYHWKAVYVKAELLEEALEAGIFGAKYS